MAKAKKNRKKILTVLGIICAALAVVAALWFRFKPPAALEVSHASASLGSITQTLDTSGRVMGENKGNLSMLDGIKVLEVSVGVGERISAGQVLATFDEPALEAELNKKQQAYNTALSTYQNSKATAASAKEQLTQVNVRIEEIDKEIAERAAKKENAAEPESTQPSGQSQNLLSTIRGLLQGDLSQIMQGLNSVTSLLGGGSALGYDMSSMMGSSSLEMEKMQLQLQLTVLEAQAGDTLSGVYESLVSSAKSALEETRAVVEKARGGWVAENDGIVREISVKAGEVFINPQGGASQGADMAAIGALLTGGGDADLSGMLGSLMSTGGTGKTYGMVLEYYPFTATFILNKNNMQQVRVGQTAIITTPAGNQITGELIYKSPVAESGGSAVDISSLLGSGSSEAGVAAKVSIPVPDESVIIGMDVNISLELNTAEDALLIPLTAVQRNESGNYVWVYDPASGVVSQTPVELGMFDRANRQVLSGLSEEDIVLLPKSQQDAADLTAGRKVKLK